MFANPGKIIMEVARILFVLTLTILVAFGMFLIMENQVITGLFIIIGGGLGAYISSLLLYGYGQLVADTHNIAVNSEIIVDCVAEPDPPVC